MKAILISIKPKWVAKILNGEKTIEIRKTMPKCDLPIDVYIYCTKENKAINCGNDESLLCSAIQALNSLGKVVAKFTLNKVEEIPARIFSVCAYPYTKTLDDYELLDKSCLLTDELETYLGNNIGYAWHISNLVIFDRPRELSEFYITHITIDVGKKIRTPLMYPRRLTKAPQSFMFIEVE